MNAPIKPPDQFAEAKRFLLALSPNGPWVLTTIHPTARGTDTMFCDTIEHAMKFIAENNGKRNIYFTAQPVRPVSSRYVYLASLTGNRRNWCVRTLLWIELDVLSGAVDQLWAEAVAQEIDEPDLFLPQELWGDAKAVQEEREIENPFADRIDELLGDEDGFVFALDILEALSIPIERAGPREYMKLAHAMNKLGFVKIERARNKKRMSCYERITSPRRCTPQMFRFQYDQDKRRWVRAVSWYRDDKIDKSDLDELNEFLNSETDEDESDED